MRNFRIGEKIIINKGGNYAYVYTQEGSIGVIKKKEGASYDVQFYKLTGKPKTGYNIFAIEEKFMEYFIDIDIVLKTLEI